MPSTPVKKTIRTRIPGRIPVSVVRKADVLLEALPYLQAFRGRTFVIKVGGSSLCDAQKRRAILQDIVFLSTAGIRPVLVHGGGPEISRQMTRQGKAPRFVQGLRVTDAETLKTVIQALRRVNRMLVSELRAVGGRAQGLLGCESGLIRAEPYVIGGQELGFVGKVVGVNGGPIQRLLVLGVIPVLIPVGVSWDHQAYNVNADEAAAAMAAGLKAEKFVLMTNVPGILARLHDHRSLLSTATIRQARGLIEKEAISGGMIPKARACIHAVQGGVRKTHIIDAEIPHALLLEIFTDRGIGTEITS